MTLPENIVLTMRRLLDGEASSAPEAAAYLADELRDWAQDPAGYVPREVLVKGLEDATGMLKAVRVEPRLRVNHGVVARAEAMLAGHLPAWFVLADFARMTNVDRRACWEFITAASQTLAINGGAMLTAEQRANIRRQLERLATGQVMTLPGGWDIGPPG